MNTQFNGMIQVGQRVHCTLHGGRDGIVIKIHGQQTPVTCRNVGGIMVTGGSASFDVVWDDGTTSRMLPESLLRGSVQWRVHDDVRGIDEVIDAERFARNKAAYDAEQREATQQRRRDEMAKHEADNPHLTAHSAKPDWSPGRLAAANIRVELKRSFPGIRFSVRSDYSSVRVAWTNGPTTAEVESITSKYKAGHFDGMTDCYEYDADQTFAKVFGSPRYVSTSRDYADSDLELLARDYCRFEQIAFERMDQYVGGDWYRDSLWTITRQLMQGVSMTAKQSIVCLEQTSYLGAGDLTDFYRVVVK